MARTSDETAWLRTFGYRVRRLREAVGLSQAELAHRADLHPTYVSGIERGLRNVSLINIRRLALALDLLPAQLLGELPAQAVPGSASPRSSES